MPWTGPFARAISVAAHWQATCASNWGQHLKAGRLIGGHLFPVGGKLDALVLQAREMAILSMCGFQTSDFGPQAAESALQTYDGAMSVCAISTKKGCTSGR